MKVLMINPPHRSIGSRLAGEHLPPLGLLSIGGPLIDAGHEVKLLDADYSNMKYDEIHRQTMDYRPDVVLLGHSGSTSAQPIIDEIVQFIKNGLSGVKIVLGGVFPTYHWREIMNYNQRVDFVVCGEGEQVAIDLLEALSLKRDFASVRGLVWRNGNEIVKNIPSRLITNLDAYRIGWELMGDYRYTYWGKKRAVVIQFSRGCPYPCSYCGQSLFWKKWRHRNPQLLADEIEMLHHRYGVEVINFADENPSTKQLAWMQFLEALIAKNLNIILVGSIRADNIVRDKAHLHLYKEAGFERLLLGIENYDETVLKNIRKAGSTVKDREAIKLLRAHNILSMATYVVGFGEEKPIDFWNSFRQLLAYDPDQVQLLFVTPHSWTPYFKEIAHKKIIEPDRSKWDYKHQIMETPNIRPWLVLLFVKMIEVGMQARPKAIGRWLFHRDKKLRKAMFWYNNIGKRVWVYELYQFFFNSTLTSQSINIAAFWNLSHNNKENKFFKPFTLKNKVNNNSLKHKQHGKQRKQHI